MLAVKDDLMVIFQGDILRLTGKVGRVSLTVEA